MENGKWEIKWHGINLYLYIFIGSNLIFQNVGYSYAALHSWESGTAFLFCPSISSLWHFGSYFLNLFFFIKCSSIIEFGLVILNKLYLLMIYGYFEHIRTKIMIIMDVISLNTTIPPILSI